MAKIDFYDLYTDNFIPQKLIDLWLITIRIRMEII